MVYFYLSPLSLPKGIEEICWGFYKIGSPGVRLLHIVIDQFSPIPKGGGGG